MGNCSQVNNTTIKGTSAVTYDSTPLPCTDVNTCDGLNTILSKFDTIICDIKANVDVLTEDVMNLTEDVMVITEDITNINNQLDICCPTTTTTTTLPPTTTTTTSSSSTSTTTSTSTTATPTTTSTSTSTSTSTTTSTSSTTTTTTTFPPLQLCIEYEVSGANTFVNWTDCDGNPQSYELTELQVYMLCALEGTVTAPGAIIYPGGPCGGEITTTTTTTTIKIIYDNYQIEDCITSIVYTLDKTYPFILGDVVQYQVGVPGTGEQRCGTIISTITNLPATASLFSDIPRECLDFLHCPKP